MWMIYLAIHLTFAQIDLYYVMGDLQLMVDNLTETGLLFIMIFRLISAKFSRKLRTIISLAIEFIDAKHFRADEEWQLYLNYHRRARSYFKVVVPIAIVTTFMFWFKPMQLRLTAGTWDNCHTYSEFKDLFLLEFPKTRASLRLHRECLLPNPILKNCQKKM